MVQEINAVAKPALVVNIEAIRCRALMGTTSPWQKLRRKLNLVE